MRSDTRCFGIHSRKVDTERYSLKRKSQGCASPCNSCLCQHRLICSKVDSNSLLSWSEFDDDIVLSLSLLVVPLEDLKKGEFVTPENWIAKGVYLDVENVLRLIIRKEHVVMLFNCCSNFF